MQDSINNLILDSYLSKTSNIRTDRYRWSAGIFIIYTKPHSTCFCNSTLCYNERPSFMNEYIYYFPTKGNVNDSTPTFLYFACFSRTNGCPVAFGSIT